MSEAAEVSESCPQSDCDDCFEADPKVEAVPSDMTLLHRSGNGFPPTNASGEVAG